MLEIDMDFDFSSKMWMCNKIKLENGNYKYICGKLTKNNTRCKNSLNCKIHKTPMFDHVNS